MNFISTASGATLSALSDISSSRVVGSMELGARITHLQMFIGQVSYSADILELSFYDKVLRGNDYTSSEPFKRNVEISPKELDLISSYFPNVAELILPANQQVIHSDLNSRWPQLIKTNNHG